jgi:hypothetical protein
MRVLQSTFIYECISIVQENFGQKIITHIFAWKVRMGFNVTLGKLQHIQNIDDIP